MLIISSVLASTQPTHATIPRAGGTGDCDTAHEVARAFREPLDATAMKALEGALRCDRVGLFPVKDTFLQFERAKELLARTDLPPAQQADLALTVAAVGQEFHRGPYVRLMVGQVLESIATRKIEALLPELTPTERAGLHGRLTHLMRGPKPDLEGERLAIREWTATDWSLAPFTSWCLGAVDESTAAIQPIFELEGDARRQAILAIETPAPSDWPWDKAASRCTWGAGTVLLQWHDERIETDARWAELAAITALPSPTPRSRGDVRTRARR